MTEQLSVLIGDYISKLMAIGFGTGTVLGLIVILGGYAIAKALSLVDNT